MAVHPRYIILLGPPASGKGTQAEMLEKKLKLPVIATGELFREEIEKNSKMGKILKPMVEQGEIVDNEIFKELIIKRLTKKDAQRGAIFDGYPRDIEQQDFLTSILERLTDEKDYIYAILIDISDKEVKRRLRGRRSCDCGAVYHLEFNPPQRDEICDLCGRKLYVRDDDKPEIIDERLKLYHSETEPLLNYWRKTGRLIKINGEQNIDKVHGDITEKLKAERIL